MKKTFALGAVATFGGFIAVAGCLGDPSESRSAMPVEAGPDVGVDGHRSSPSDPGSDDPSWIEEAGSCPTIDATKYPYKPAKVALGSCTTQELTDLGAYFKERTDANEDVTLNLWAAVVSKGS